MREIVKPEQDMIAHARQRIAALRAKVLDANLLLVPCVGFLPVTDPRIEQTVAAIERDLVRDGFVIMTKDEARRIALGIAKLPDLLSK